MGVQLHGGWFQMPAFGVADDGYLFLHGGKVYSGPLGCRRIARSNSLDTSPGWSFRLSGAHEGRLAPVTTGSHVQNCGNCSRANSIVRDV